MSGKSVEFGSLGPGRGAPFVVPLALGILAVTAVMLLVVDPPDLGDWVMVGLVATGLAARRQGYRVTERAAPGGVAREVRQEAGAAAPLD